MRKSLSVDTQMLIVSLLPPTAYASLPLSLIQVTTLSWNRLYASEDVERHTGAQACRFKVQQKDHKVT